MRVAVTGAAGRIGRLLVPLLRPDHDVVALGHDDLDIGDPAAVGRAFDAISPDLVVNLAAMTDVDACERDPERAERDNAGGPLAVGAAATSVDAAVLHVSTSFVFDGTSPDPYDEDDVPGPLSVYARSKLAGERAVLAASPRNLVVRTDALFGDGIEFASRALVRLAAGETVEAIDDRICSPTYLPDLAERLAQVVAAGASGILHLAGSEPSTWFALIERARRVADLPGTVVGRPIADLRLDAPRPRNSSLTSTRLAALGLAPLPSLDDAIRRWTVDR